MSASGTAPAGGRQWWVVGCLTILSMLAFIDRNIIVLMVRPIQLDLGLSATQVTLAIGTAFAAANLLIGVPAGWAADRLDRRAIAGFAVVLWSVMTMSCGLAGGFLGLFLLRGGVGLAEGLLPPASYSLIRDSVAPHQRARAFSLFAMSTLAGTGVAFLLGGLLIKYVSVHSFAGAPMLAAMKPWSRALVLVGLGGLPFALLMLTVREPRQGRVQGDGDAARAPREPAWGTLWTGRRIFAPLAVYSVASAMLTNSINIWVSPMLGARFGLSPLQIGLPMGLSLLILGPAGLFVAGAAVDRLERKGRPGSGLLAIAAPAWLFVTAVLQPLAPTPASFWWLQGLLLLAATSYLVVTSTLVARACPPQMTGRVIAIFLVAQGVLGIGVAPTLTAFVIDHVFKGRGDAIALSMSIVHGVYAAIALCAGIALYAATRRLQPAEAAEVTP